MNKYLSFVAFHHTLFALPFAVMAYFFAAWWQQYGHQWNIFLLVLLCMVLARSAAMAFNRLIDAPFDALNPRTSHREIPQGMISKRMALGIVIGTGLGFWLTTYFINMLCFWLAPLALFVILGYSFTKRFTPYSHWVLGMGLGLAPVGAYLAVTGQFDPTAVVLGLAVMMWVAGFDIIYALQDIDADRRQGLYSLPAQWGKTTALRVAAAMHIASVILLAGIGLLEQLGLWYWLGLLLFALLMVRQHVFVRTNHIAKVDAAFFTFNGTASVVFCCFVLLEFYMKQ